MQPRETVLRTLALADAFGWALTAFEVWQYAIREGGEKIQPGFEDVRVSETLTALDALVVDGALVEQPGHYAFAGQEALIQERLWRTHLIEQKRRKARRWARRMLRLPYVEGVFAYGSLATGHTKKESDLDVFVVLRDNRIFLGRLVTTLLLEMFGVRRTATKITDQVCLNHFVVASALEFPEEYRSPFSAWLWARMFPLAADKKLAERFYRANVWVTDYFPNLERSQRVERVKGSKTLLALPLYPLLRFGDAVEWLLGRYQLKRIAQHPLTHAGTGRVVAGERMMIFHPALPEEEGMERLRARCENLHIQ